MEVDQIQCKFPRISNGYGSQSQRMDDQCPDDEEEGENKRSTANDSGSGGGAYPGGGVGLFDGWPSSRIVRVSRATGGKDRHSKVLTSKGLRDRRVRLSVNTAIQFYDLQDRLGYDQPSKAVEWLLTAAASSIAELPPMKSPFGDSTKQLSGKKRSDNGVSYQLEFNSVDAVIDGGGGNRGQLPQELVTNKSSAASSNSDNSKGSGISIFRSQTPIKARDRAKERVLEKEKEKEKEKENDSSYVASFTELLSGGINFISRSQNGNSINFDGSVHKNLNRGNGENMDYFTSGLLVPAPTRPSQVVASPLFSVAAYHHSELQPFSFASDNLVSAVDSPGIAAINRGTLQSNSPSLPSLPPPRFPPSDGSPPNFFLGAAVPNDNHHHFLPEFDARLQLYYGDARGRNSGQNGNEKK